MISLANNEWRDNHKVKDNLVIISYDDLRPKSSILYMFMSFNLDVDYIMLNQIMFTFRRNNGYLYNNVTSESWIWKEHQYGEILLNLKYDANENFTIYLVVFIFSKIKRSFAASFGFMLLSFVNGFVVRIALICSNCFIFPIIALTTFISNEDLAPNDQAQIYQ